MVNSISRQNDEAAINMLAAQRTVYSTAKMYWAVLLIANLLLVPAISIYVIFNQPLAPYAAVVGLAILTLNGFFTYRIDRYKELAASIQELFDNYVLSIPLNSLILADDDLQELIDEYANKYFTRHTDESLIDWYADSLKDMPLTKAQATAQRINSWWDGKLRRAYVSSLVAIGLLVALCELIIGLVLGLDLSAFILIIVVPILPVLQLSISEAYRHHTASKSADRNLKEAKMLIKNHQSAHDFDIRVRSLQDSIFSHRITAPLVFNFVYKMSRSVNEKIMKKTAKSISEK